MGQLPSYGHVSFKKCMPGFVGEDSVPAVTLLVISGNLGLVLRGKSSSQSAALPNPHQPATETTTHLMFVSVCSSGGPTSLDSDKLAAEFLMTFGGHAMTIDQPLIFSYDSKIYTCRIKEVEGLCGFPPFVMFFFCNVGVGVTVFVGVWALFWAVNVEAVEGRNVSNDCALNQSQKRCFMMFY